MQEESWEKTRRGRNHFGCPSWQFLHRQFLQKRASFSRSLSERLTRQRPARSFQTRAEKAGMGTFLVLLGILLSIPSGCAGQWGIPTLEMLKGSPIRDSSQDTEKPSPALSPQNGKSVSADSSASQSLPSSASKRSASGKSEWVRSAEELSLQKPFSQQGWVRSPVFAPRPLGGIGSTASLDFGAERDEEAPAEQSQMGFRWHDPDLEEMLAQADDPEALLQEALTSNDPIMAANAAIVLGRSGSSEVVPRLVETVRNRRLQMGMRLAAAEALGYVRADESKSSSAGFFRGNWWSKVRAGGGGGADGVNTWRQQEPPLGKENHEGAGKNSVAAVLRELVDEYGPEEGLGRRRYQPELHGELLRSLARHVDISSDDRFRTALRSPSPVVQQAALEAWEQARGPLPEEVADLRTAQDSAVRAAVLRVLAQHRHPQALQWLRAGLGDSDLTVRLAAIEGLGRWGGPDSCELLRPLLQDHTERIRAAAVHALAQADDQQAVFRAAGDSSWRVRQAVAEALTHYPTRAGQELALRLLKDSAAPVPAAVLRAIRNWPLAQAGPVLLEAMAREVLWIRQEGAAQLAQRWAPAKEFLPDAPPERRKEVLAQLVRSFQDAMADQSTEESEVSGSVRADSVRVPSLSAVQWAQVEKALAVLADASAPASEVQQSMTELKAFGPGLVGVVQTWVCERKRALPEPVFQELLPAVSNEFLLVERLRSGEVSVRRRAAAELAQQAHQTPLSPLAVERLAWIVPKESDKIVWQSVLEAVAEDGSEPAMRLAAAGLGHPGSEVRRAACEHFCRHPDPAYRDLLSAVVEDGQDTVALAALEALGTVGLRPEEAVRLERLLAHKNPEVVLRAATLLAGLGRESGVAALERLAFHEDPALRRKTAQIMGSLGHPSFVPILIRLLDEGHGIRRTALESLSQIVQTPPTELQKPNASVTEQVEAWKHWWAKQGRQASCPTFSQTDPSLKPSPEDGLK